MDWYWSWILSAVGLLGFFLAGSKVWWAWYVNIANQVIWTVYSIVTEQWGFLVGTAFYFVVFIRNAVKWTKEHKAEQRRAYEEYLNRVTKRNALPNMFWVHESARQYAEFEHSDDGFTRIRLKGDWHWYTEKIDAERMILRQPRGEAVEYARGTFYVRHDDGVGPLLLSKGKLIGKYGG